LSYDILENFEDLKGCSTYCRYIVYKIDDLVDKYRVRLQAGRFAFDSTVSKNRLEEICVWLKSVDAIKVTGSVTKEAFFA